MELDTLLLSRIQFALTVMFHYIFPPLSIGLGMLMVLMEGLYLRTRDPLYSNMTRFWVRIFALNFAVGVASGIVMEFQFGTNWSRYSRFVGDVFGSALAAEGIFAFFLESGFLSVLVFGWDRVSPRMHFFSTCMVALGSIFSAVWIVIANSWQQTPAGHHIVEHLGVPRAEIVDFWGMVFNPSSMFRLLHVLLAAFLLGAFFVMSISAYYLLKGRHLPFAKKAMTLALIFGECSNLAMMVSGHFQAKTMAMTQPPKLAAFEALFRTEEGGTGMYLIGWPDAAAEKVHFGVKMPGLLSFLVHEDPTLPVAGFDRLGRPDGRFAPKEMLTAEGLPRPDGVPLAAEDRPPVLVPFLCYRVMLGMGTIMFGLNTLGIFFWWRGTLFEKRWLLRCFVGAVLAPFLANQAGWIAAEVGRQPWVVYGLLRTADAHSPSVPGGEVLASILMFSFVYLLLFAVWVFVLNSKIQHGPDPIEGGPTPPESGGDLLEAAARLGKSTGFSLTGTDASSREAEEKNP